MKKRSVARMRMFVYKIDDEIVGGWLLDTPANASMSRRWGCVISV